ncbi:MAG: methyltransferase domain-containing protein [Gemmatimonadaceae bacterium]|nr:methyltransferase domain-containing protein [Gemmatimonadaceae bacterium]
MDACPVFANEPESLDDTRYLVAMNDATGRTPYETWQQGPARAGDLVVTVATKPGVFAHGGLDAPSAMLAEAVAEHSASAGHRSLHLGSGNGWVPAVAKAVGYAPTAIDRYVTNAEATRRTLDAQPGAAHMVHHAALASPFVAPDSCALVTIRIATDKLGVQLAVAEAFRTLAIGGTCLLAGANDEGAKPAAKLLESVFGNAQLAAQHSGCRLLVATKRSAVAGDDTVFDNPWLDADHFHELPVTLAETGFVASTRPGVFSWEHVDEATGILADLMRIENGESVIDLGCGAGILGIAASRWSPQGRVLMLDADADAVRCATRSAAQAGSVNVEVRASDVASAAADARVDVVVSNPPFHLGKGTELAIPRAFIEQAYRHLTPGGRLYLVANRTLPYERLIGECFGEVLTAHDGRRFKVIGGVRRA